MASSYSTDLKLELMVTGENAGTWGDKTNTNLNLVQQAIAGVEGITLTDSATTTLTMSDAALSNARNMVLKINTITLTGATILALPDGIEKFYILDATQITAPTNLTFKTTSGTGFALTDAKIYAAYSDGTNISEISLNTLGGTIAAANITGTIATAQIADNAITTAKISANQVTTAKIADGQITTAKIADDAVGPDQLSNTAVTAGSYTTADITVDAQGRVTAASSGQAGGGNMVFGLYASTSGTYTAPANTNKVHVYIQGGGGGGAGANQQSSAGPGGAGGYGLFPLDVTPNTGYPYTLGNGGNGGNGSTNSSNPGNPGNASNFHTLATSNGGGGRAAVPYSNSAGPGTDGTVPGGISLAPIGFAPYPPGTRNFYGVPARGHGGAKGNQPVGSGGTGQSGGIFIFENSDV